MALRDVFNPLDAVSGQHDIAGLFGGGLQPLKGESVTGGIERLRGLAGQGVLRRFGAQKVGQDPVEYLRLKAQQIAPYDEKYAQELMDRANELESRNNVLSQRQEADQNKANASRTTSVAIDRDMQSASAELMYAKTPEEYKEIRDKWVKNQPLLETRIPSTFDDNTKSVLSIYAGQRNFASNPDFSQAYANKIDDEINRSKNTINSLNNVINQLISQKSMDANAFRSAGGDAELRRNIEARNRENDRLSELNAMKGKEQEAPFSQQPKEQAATAEKTEQSQAPIAAPVAKPAANQVINPVAKSLQETKQSDDPMVVIGQMIKSAPDKVTRERYEGIAKNVADENKNKNSALSEIDQATKQLEARINKIKADSRNGSAPISGIGADLAVYVYMKNVDPNSAIMSGEFDRIANTNKDFADVIKSKIAGLSGQKYIQPNQVKDIISLAENQLNTLKMARNNIQNKFKSYASDAIHGAGGTFGEDQGKTQGLKRSDFKTLSEYLEAKRAGKK